MTSPPKAQIRRGADRVSAPARLLMRWARGLDHDELAFYFLRGSSAGST
jgi:hypothetical protein